MDDKCTAMQMLVVYAKDLKEGFADYAEGVSLSCSELHLVSIVDLTCLCVCPSASTGGKDDAPSFEVLLQ